MWLHTNRSEGCTSRAINGAAANGHLRMMKWLHANRTEGCTKTAVEYAITHRQLDVFKHLYGSEELKGWPRYHHAPILAKLACFFHGDDVALLKYIARCRQERFCSDAADNPFASSAFETLEPVTALDRAKAFIPTAVIKVTEVKKLAPELSEHISEYATSNPRETALKRRWIYWLVQFSDRPNEDMLTLAQCSSMNGVRVMHDRLAQQYRLRCSKRLMYLTVEKGNLELIKWHMGSCEAHSIKDWVYVATWIGRVGSIDWICASNLEIRQGGSITMHKSCGKQCSTLSTHRSLKSKSDSPSIWAISRLRWVKKKRLLVMATYGQ